jgi:hypothetical protein
MDTRWMTAGWVVTHSPDLESWWGSPEGSAALREITAGLSLAEDTWRSTVTEQWAIVCSSFSLRSYTLWGMCQKKRFRGCQGEGQRSAGVRKSISLRSLLSPFNLMKPLLVKASAWHLALWSRTSMGSRWKKEGDSLGSSSCQFNRPERWEMHGPAWCRKR